MSNLLKGYYINVDKDEKRKVDSNEMVARRVKEEEVRRQALLNLTDMPEGDDGFSEGLFAQNIDVLLDDDNDSIVIKGGAGQTPNSVVNPACATAQTELDEINAQIEEARSQLEALQAEAAGVLEAAEQEAGNIKSQAYEEGRAGGYEAGYNEGMSSLESMRAQLEEQRQTMESDYQAQIEALEPKFVDTLTDIYEHIFRIDLDSFRNVISQLLIDTIIDSGVSRNIIVHVSRNDFSEIIGKKEVIIEETGLVEANIDFIMDATLADSQCMIETDGGVFDCSLETELKELKRKLMILAYQKNEC